MLWRNELSAPSTSYGDSSKKIAGHLIAATFVHIFPVRILRISLPRPLTCGRIVGSLSSASRPFSLLIYKKSLRSKLLVFLPIAAEFFQFFKSSEKASGSEKVFLVVSQKSSAGRYTCLFVKGGLRIWLSEPVGSKQLYTLNAVVCRLCTPMAGVGIDTNPYRIRYP
jgi:hypothetical protein